MGVVLVAILVSSNNLSNYTVSTFTNFSSNFSFTKLMAANRTLSGLIPLIKIIFLNLSHLPSQSPGKGEISG